MTAVALSVLSGVLDFLGFVGFGIFPLAWVAWVPVLAAVRRAGLKRTFWLGLLFGTVAHLGGYYWVEHLLREFGGVPPALALLGLLLLCAYQGLVFALVLVLVRAADRDLGIAPVWAMAAAYPAVEFLLPMLFPYSIGSSQYRFLALTQIVEVTGMLGLTVLIALLNGAAYEAVAWRLERRRLAVRRVAVPLALFAAFTAYGLVRIPQVDRETAGARRLRVALIQANIGARDKEARRDEFIDRHIDMSRTAVAGHPGLDLLVWPETAYDDYVPRAETNVAGRLGLLGVPVLFGARTWEPADDAQADVYNSALLASAEGDVLGRFDKVELLAFGETIPFVDTFPALRKWFPRSSTFARGRTLQAMDLAQARLLPTICYEDILAGFVRRLWRAAGPADAIVNLTNDSWYGDSHEPWIHLVLASFRSIETRRPMIRSTNTGISAFVDPVGRIGPHSGQWTQEVLVGEVPLIEHGRSTPYMKIGDLLGWAACAVVLAGLFRRRASAARRGRPETPPPAA